MTNLFLQILNASITASWLIGAVVLVRFVVKRTAPRWIVCLLWGLVAVRLVLPFEVESSFSLVPDTPKITLEESIEVSAEPEFSLQAPPVEQLGNTSRPTEEISHDSTPVESIPEESTEESAPEESISEESTEESVPEISTEESMEESIEESTEESFEESMDTSAETSTEISTEASTEESVPTVVGSVTNPPSAGDSGISTATVAGIVWLCGLAALAVYALVNYLLLKKQVAIFVPDKRGFRRCEFIDTPFVLGFFRPRIYLPYGLSSAYEPYILAHEQAHIRRLDHLVKPVAYLVLALHWFNPLVWLSFVLFCKDIEYACDEKVLKNAAADIRKDYASALLECASKRSFLAACPIAFGEVSVKERVKTTMSYKKPFLWVMILCIILCAVVAVLFCTSPADTEGTPSQEQSTEDVLDTSEDTESPGSEPAEMPDYAEFIPLRMQYLTMESEPELFYASRGEESWLYIPAWEQTVHLSSYILDERSSGALSEDEAVFVGTNADNGEPYALYARKGIRHVEKKKIGITDEAKSFTTFCDNTDTFSKFSVLVFATTEDEVIPYHCSIQNFTEYWPVTYLPDFPTIPAGLTPVMADYAGGFHTGYIAFQPVTGNAGYIELYSSNYSKDGSQLIKWNHHATIVCPAYEGLVSAQPINIKRISRNSTKMIMTVRVVLENDEPQHVTFQGENSFWSMDPVENKVSYSFEIPAEKKTTAVSIDKFDLDPTSMLSLKPTSGYALPEYAILGLNGEVYRDQSNAFYLYDSQNLYCINTGETLPVELPYDVFDIAFGSDRLYCLRANGSIMIFDTSRGLGSSTLLEETKPRADFVYRNLYVYQDELLVYDDDLSPVCNIDGEARQLPYALTAIASKNMFVYKADGRYLLYNQGAKEPYRYCASDDNGITLALPGTGVLYSDTTRWWENPYLRFDKDGNVLSRVIVKRESTLLRTPCQIPFYTSEGVQHTVLKHAFYTLSINEFTVENLIDYRLFWNEDGTCYLLAVTAEHLEIYLVTPGVTRTELTARTAENSTRKEFETIFTWYSLTGQEAEEMLEASVDFVPGRGINITEEDEPIIYTAPIFHLRDEFIAYFTNYSRLEAKLSTYGINCKVKDAIFVESPLFSSTIRVVTTEDTLYFLAVKDTGRTYEFTVYTEEEFVKACLRFPAAVYVNGQEIESHLTPEIYGNYADIPFLALMEGLDASIEWWYEDYAVITLGGNTCAVHTSQSSLVYENASYSTVTEAFDRDNGNEILVRSDVLQQFLDAFCPGAEIRIDHETDAVYIAY